jgi:hypothetical protein
MAFTDYLPGCRGDGGYREDVRLSWDERGIQPF